MKRPRAITMEDIAKELKISVATVSRAFRNTYDVREKTRSKVLLKSKELNFRPNYNAIGLVNNKSNNIAVIVPILTDYYFSKVLTGIQNIADQNDYRITLHITGESVEREIFIAKQLP